MASPRTCWEPQAWRDAHPNCIPLWEMIDITDLQFDIMHTKPLGADAYFIASVLCYLVDTKMEHIAATNLNIIWESIKRVYKQRQTICQFTTISLNMIRPGQSPFPCIKGKAAEIRHLLPILETISPEFLDDNNVPESLMMKGWQLSRGIDSCLNVAGRAPRPENPNMPS